MSEVALVRLPSIIERYYAEARAFARRKLGSTAIAEDIVQEACLRLASTGDAKIENPRALLYRIVGNLVIDQQRTEQSRRRILVESSADVADGVPDAERQLIAKQRLAMLFRAIEELPPRCRECFEMRRFQDLDHDEIARRMGITRSMVEKHLRLALTHCAQRLRDHD
jgi:RNA polymerase sigma factor (sigma-70 family)